MFFEFKYRFEAAHRLTSAESKMCQTPHGHTWYATLKLKAEVGELDNANMVVEFQKTKKNWKKFIKETVDHSFLVNQDDVILPALKESIEGLRAIPFPGDPTTEMIAILFLRKAQKLVVEKGLSAHSILIEETPVNSVEVAADSPIFVNTLKRLEDCSKEVWWESSF